MVTIREVARKCGYSASTVSMVLNDAPLAKYIPASTQATIRRIAHELNYKPNIFARSLRENKSDTVGVMVFDITDPYCTYNLRGIENKLNAASMAYLLFDAQNKRERFHSNLEAILQRRVDGLILVANSLQTDPSVLEALRTPQVPVVVIGREMNGMRFASTVTINNHRGGYLAMEHLYQLGHRDIAFIRGPKTIADSMVRWEGVVDFCKEAGLKFPRDSILDLTEVPTTSSEGLRCVKSLLKSRRRFTAVLAFDDMTALGVIRGLSEAGLEVPRDCSVIGFDDIDAARYYNPPLTTIRQPMLQMGEEGAGILLEAIRAVHRKKRSLKVERVLEPQVIVRSSTQARNRDKDAYARLGSAKRSK